MRKSCDNYDRNQNSANQMRSSYRGETSSKRNKNYSQVYNPEIYGPPLNSIINEVPYEKPTLNANQYYYNTKYKIERPRKIGNYSTY